MRCVTCRFYFQKVLSFASLLPFNTWLIVYIYCLGIWLPAKTENQNFEKTLFTPYCTCITYYLCTATAGIGSMSAVPVLGTVQLYVYCYCIHIHVVHDIQIHVLYMNTGIHIHVHVHYMYMYTETMWLFRWRFSSTEPLCPLNWEYLKNDRRMTT